MQKQSNKVSSCAKCFGCRAEVCEAFMIIDEKSRLSHCPYLKFLNSPAYRLRLELISASYSTSLAGNGIIALAEATDVFINLN